MDHDDVVKDIKAMLEGAEPPGTNECCIYRVPFGIRILKEDAYTPKVVSIGPFHHRHPRLHNMERHKVNYCMAFLARTKTSLDSWIRYIEGVEPNFRRCYSDTLQFSKEELVKIIFMDSGFILELFWRDHSKNWASDDPCFSIPWVRGNITYDLLLLENQLPFFVLDDLFNLSFSFTSTSDGGGNYNNPSFIELTFHYFASFNKSELKYHDISIRHFTDLIRTFHLQHPPQRRPRMADILAMLLLHMHSATDLSEAGVIFEENTESDCLLDLKFSGGVLKIPPLKVGDWTELLFSNMVALEQCHYPYESYITDYVLVLDFLVNTSRDVDILARKRVLINLLGDSDSVANLFNGLCKNIVLTEFNSHYFHLLQDLHDFYRNPWNNMKSTLRRDYCNSPWQTAATIAGIVLLILSLVQSVCSVLQVTQQ